MPFHHRRAEQPTMVWSDVLSLLEDDDRRAAVRYEYPLKRRESFLGALRELDADAAARLMGSGRKLESAAQLIHWPTVAVAGMLNSGKTSLVASFLSPSGRARTLRGAGNREGTHRFVLWLPSQWRQREDLWSLLMARIGETLGNEVEMLADAPEQAHAQYNNDGGDEGQLRTPLVATDPALDDAGIGLLDCPDIVSDEAFGLGSPAIRRDLLGRAATVCSAFLVVASAESSRDSTLGDLMRIASGLMPGVPRFLAVNKVRPRQTPEQVLDAFAPMVESHDIREVYAAYDFDIPASRSFMPKSDGEAASSDEDDPLPVFFRVDADPDRNPPAAIEPDRLLSALPDQLDRAELFAGFERALQTNLATAIWNQGWEMISGDVAQSVQATRRSQECLLQSALEFFAYRPVGGDVTELRLLQNKRVVRQLSDSFVATAPWYAKWGVKIHQRLRSVVDSVKDFAGRLTPSSLARATARDIEERFTSGELGGFLTPKRLVEAIDRHRGRDALPHWPAIESAGGREAFEEAAEAAILHFERTGVTALDPRRLDEATAEMWSKIPTRRKLVAGLTPLAATLAAFGGVLMIPIDFGASAVGLASIPELLGALGLSAASTMWAGDQSMRDVGHQAARQQLSDFHAVLCDVFGLHRPNFPPTIRVGGTQETLSDPRIETRTAYDEARVLPLVATREAFPAELSKLVPPPKTHGS